MHANTGTVIVVKFAFFAAYEVLTCLDHILITGLLTLC